MYRNKPFTAPVRKKYIGPFWCMIAIIMIRSIIVAWVVYSLKDLIRTDQISVRAYAERAMRSQLISNGTVIGLLMLEAILYWRVRYWIVRKSNAWLHVAGLTFAIVVQPLLYGLYNVWFGRTHDPKEAARLASQVNFVLLIGVLVAAHLFFVLLLIEAHKKRKEAKTVPAPEGPDMLNDYA